jgi:mutator protein MutT
VGAVIFDRAGRVLLVKRAHEPLKGHWSLPGGVVEAGETLAAAVTREVREETCLDVEVGPVVEIVERITADATGRTAYHFVIVDYLCRAVTGELACSSDAEAAEWVPPAELERFDLTTAALDVIRKASALGSTTART